MTLCECGCGVTVKEGNRFINGHNSRGKKRPEVAKLMKGRKKSKEHIEKIKKVWIKKYENGYINPTKGEKRPDLVEYNKKFKSEQMKGEKNPNKRPEVIAKRLKTIAGKTKEIYGRKGPKNNNWRGGISFDPYGYEFNKELKLAIKIRDGFKCFVCKVKDENTSQGLHIHHIDYNKQNNNPENLVALCGKCNSKANGHRQVWIEYFSRSFNVERESFTYKQIQEYCVKVAEFLENKKVSGIVPIPRGGVVPGVILSYLINKPIKEKVTSPEDVIIDEIVDFGMTFKRIKKEHPKNIFVCLCLNSRNFRFKIKPDFYVIEIDKWAVFPWEIK